MTYRVPTGAYFSLRRTNRLGLSEAITIMRLRASARCSTWNVSQLCAN